MAYLSEECTRSLDGRLDGTTDRWLGGIGLGRPITWLQWGVRVATASVSHSRVSGPQIIGQHWSELCGTEKDLGGPLRHVLSPPFLGPVIQCHVLSLRSYLGEELQDTSLNSWV